MNTSDTAGEAATVWLCGPVLSAGFHTPPQSLPPSFLMKHKRPTSTEQLLTPNTQSGQCLQQSAASGLKPRQFKSLLYVSISGSSEHKDNSSGFSRHESQGVCLERRLLEQTEKTKSPEGKLDYICILLAGQTPVTSKKSLRLFSLETSSSAKSRRKSRKRVLRSIRRSLSHESGLTVAASELINLLLHPNSISQHAVQHQSLYTVNTHKRFHVNILYEFSITGVMIWWFIISMSNKCFESPRLFLWSLHVLHYTVSRSCWSSGFGQRQLN